MAFVGHATSRAHRAPGRERGSARERQDSSSAYAVETPTTKAKIFFQIFTP